MIKSGTVYNGHGYTVSVSQRGGLFDLETKNPAGETVSTVVLTSYELGALQDQIDEVRFP